MKFNNLTIKIYKEKIVNKILIIKHFFQALFWLSLLSLTTAATLDTTLADIPAVTNAPQTIVVPAEAVIREASTSLPDTTQVPEENEVEMESHVLPLAPEESNELPLASEASNALPIAPEASNALPIAPEASNALPLAPEASNVLPLAPEASNALPIAPKESTAQLLPIAPEVGQPHLPTPAPAAIVQLEDDQIPRYVRELKCLYLYIFYCLSLEIGHCSVESIPTVWQPHSVVMVDRAKLCIICSLLLRTEQ